ncbi:hypothetical protein CesoFtcFv8_001326 [Champsocephalus esox]|uniref:Uncharacterized protein n=1 Tax=Champsocephalus esox TaxID=159716 RepID=A0AAN8DDN9_9TELE|nr:hypothetical protein CesoFtcFv8_001326 [Champsocephalus esox]
MCAGFIWPEKEYRVGVALYAAAAEGRGSMRQQRESREAVSCRPGVAAVWADRAEPSTRRDLGWLLWKETRQESEGERGGETLTDSGEKEV